MKQKRRKKQLRKSRNRRQKKGCESEGGENKIDENNKNIKVTMIKYGRKETFFFFHSCASAVDDVGLK